jgi:regulator of PEP synthase PpsR (kinase-PPPase family)
VLKEIENAPGVVLYTIADEGLRAKLEERCRELGSPTLPVIDGAVNMLSRYLGLKSAHKVAGQYHLDAEYFARIETINFALQHDDGQQTDHLREADVVLVGVSRTSKTPTCVYLGQPRRQSRERAACARRRDSRDPHRPRCATRRRIEDFA